MRELENGADTMAPLSHVGTAETRDQELSIEKIIEHRGSILASYLAGPGSVLSVPEFFSEGNSLRLYDIYAFL